MSDKIGRYGENVNYKRYNFRSNVDMDITKTTVVNLGVQGNVTENMEPVEGQPSTATSSTRRRTLSPSASRTASWPAATA